MRRVIPASLCLLFCLLAGGNVADAGSIRLEQDPESGWDIYHLTQGDLEVRLVPSAGFNVSSIQAAGVELLRQAPSAAQLRGVGYGVPILYPTPNRVRGAAFAFEGQEFRFPANNGSNFIHGLVHSIPWTITALRVDSESASVTGELAFAEDTELFERFPRSHRIRVTVTVTPSAVRWTYEVDNEAGDKAVPYGFALHPYFNYLGGRTSSTIIIPATHVMEAEELLPTGRLLELEGHPLDARRPTSLANLHADDVYFGMRSDRPVVIDFQQARRRLELATSDDFTHLVLYTPDRPFFCVENQTCSTDAHNLAARGAGDVAHLMICPPGRKQTGWVEYRVASLPGDSASAAEATSDAAAADSEASPVAERSLARGVVYEDSNENGRRDAGERGIPGVRVSDGQRIVHTDADGRYQMPVSDDTILFIIKPRGFRTPLDENNLPQFYYIHKPNGSPAGLRFPGVAPTGPLPESIDFALYPQQEPDTFRAIMFGDPQPRDQREIDFIAHDVVEELIGTDAAFGVTLGDIVFNDLDLFESQARTIALIGIPWYNVLGNHDMNYDVDGDHHSDETFERHFGPSYYSFDYGPVHFMVLDDVQWILHPENGRPTYRGGLGAAQMEFIRNDLALVPERQLIVLMMHIPLVDVHDRHELYRLIEQRPFCMSIAAHEHFHQHVFIGREDGWQGPQKHHHVINVTVCGSWWSGQKDERGIPHATMSDGAPNGYSIITFDGHEYKLDYKAAGRPSDYQMQIHFPEVVASDVLAQTNVLVNVFNGSERSTVQMQVRGHSEVWTMERVAAEDPTFRAIAEREAQIRRRFATDDPRLIEHAGRNLPAPSATGHLWRGRIGKPLEPGTYMLEITTTDMHGRTFRDQRVFRVREAVSAQPQAGR